MLQNMCIALLFYLYVGLKESLLLLHEPPNFTLCSISVFHHSARSPGVSAVYVNWTGAILFVLYIMCLFMRVRIASVNTSGMDTLWWIPEESHGSFQFNLHSLFYDNQIFLRIVILDCQLFKILVAMQFDFKFPFVN